jgi:hypothetical protein
VAMRLPVQAASGGTGTVAPGSPGPGSDPGSLKSPLRQAA